MGRNRNRNQQAGAPAPETSPAAPAAPPAIPAAPAPAPDAPPAIPAAPAAPAPANAAPAVFHCPAPGCGAPIEIGALLSMPEIEQALLAAGWRAPRAAKAPAGPRRVSALDAAAQVLAGAGEPMGAKALITAMATEGLWESPGGATPDATLAAAIVREIAAKGEKARFIKVAPGMWIAREQPAA